MGFRERSTRIVFITSTKMGDIDGNKVGECEDFCGEARDVEKVREAIVVIKVVVVKIMVCATSRRRTKRVISFARTRLRFLIRF